MAEKLITGTYIITSLTKDRPFVGSNPPGGPISRVVTVPEDSEIPAPRVSIIFYSCKRTPFFLVLTYLCTLQWNLEELPNGRFILSIDGGRALVQDGLIVASREPIEPVEEWVLTPKVEHGLNVYT